MSERETVFLSLVFAVADLAAVRWLRSAFRSDNAIPLLLLIMSAFLAYTIGVRFISRSREYKKFYAEFSGMHPTLNFWLKLSHIAVLIYLPIALFILVLTNGARGNDLVITAMFFITPPLTLLMLVQIAKTTGNGGTTSKKARTAATGLLFWSFLFFDILFTESSGYLAGQFLRELHLSSSKSLLFLIPFRLLFLWCLFIPMRLWTFESIRLSVVEKFVLLSVLLTILFNGIF